MSQEMRILASMFGSFNMITNPFFLAIMDLVQGPFWKEQIIIILILILLYSYPVVSTFT
ncbi:hypothetical protein RchiOBHm_Chr1g0322341 [Rosa chinensis]|uniref:Uncharacterized protein n=1 Tax=Rosa chinensis TaxID=74649 RepID=A0A2P6S990_ROSCH|nr:hypothetical protein RchiOBHm_Chr1g0322341 [Rosa chinensis]